MHVPLSVQHRWYTSVLLGYYGYYGRPQNFPALHAFRQEMIRIWLTCLRRRSQKSRRMSWQTFADVLNRFPLPTLANPVQRGHRFQRKADSNPVIADSR